MVARNIKPEYSKKRVNKAGENVRLAKVNSEDILVIENWRAAHNKILNDWQASLRSRCKNKDIIFAQRLKRRTTIFDKLKRQEEMQLSRMHDIAGCRLIFNSIEDIEDFRRNLHSSWMKHIRRKSDVKPYPYDYIKNMHPDGSGYRGIHDIYKYCARPNRSTYWNNLLVEIQYRTKAQHAWATANEIAGSLTGNHSKFGKVDEKQKEFFRLASEIIARTAENRTSCYPKYTDEEIVKRFEEIERDTNLLRKLKNLRIASEKFKFSLKKNIILIYSEKTKKLEVHSYETLPIAQIRYFQIEKEKGDTHDIVLVRAPTKESLKQAYKNYFSDAKEFTSLIDSGINSLS